MDELAWRDERDDRTLRYAGRRLDPRRWVALEASAAYLETYEGQVAVLTAGNLLSRMTPSVAISFPDAPLVPQLGSYSASTLRTLVLEQMQGADPFGRFEARPPRPSDRVIHLGPDGAEVIAHGRGWNAYVGPSPSPLPGARCLNPIGPALASVLAITQLFVDDFRQQTGQTLLNALTWTHELAPLDPELPGELGRILVAGTGSVGTAAVYFLALARRPFMSTLLDMDVVRVHNLDRSPIFRADDVGLLKAHVTRDFLRAHGIPCQADARPLHDSPLWMNRSAGTPDVVIAAANELGVRYHIESQLPPVQLYGTTGRNWQAGVHRHIPLVDPCSCCLFPPDEQSPPTVCASAGDDQATSEVAPRIDAALPFLSFAAGLMTAAEILKLGFPGYPFSTNRISLTTRPMPRLVAAPLRSGEGCVCARRNGDAHRSMIRGTRYSRLSHPSHPCPP